MIRNTYGTIMTVTVGGDSMLPGVSGHAKIPVDGHNGSRLTDS